MEHIAGTGNLTSHLLLVSKERTPRLKEWQRKRKVMYRPCMSLTAVSSELKFYGLQVLKNRE